MTEQLVSVGWLEKMAYLGEDGEISTFVLWKLCVECLQQLPDVWRRSYRASHTVRAVGETNTDGLVNI